MVPSKKTTYGEYETIKSAIKSSRLRGVGAGHVTRIDNDRMAKKIFNANCRARGRLRTRWIDSVEQDVKRLKVNNWKMVAEDRQQWENVV